MSRVFVTGSADGIGLLTARSLVSQGYRVVLHARNEKRAAEASESCPGAEHVLIADLSKISETKRLAEEANKLGRFDAVIHNAGRGYRQPEEQTEDGIASVFATNSLAPYILTCLMSRPKHLVYVSSGLHASGDGSLEDVTWTKRQGRWNGFQAYCDSKLHNVLLAFAVAKYWPDVTSNAISPGWVATKMGGKGAPDSMEESYQTQIWLINDGKDQTGKYFFHQKASRSNPVASDQKKQDAFLDKCKQISGVEFPK